MNNTNEVRDIVNRAKQNLEQHVQVLQEMCWLYDALDEEFDKALDEEFDEGSTASRLMELVKDTFYARKICDKLAKTFNNNERRELRELSTVVQKNYGV